MNTNIQRARRANKSVQERVSKILEQNVDLRIYSVECLMNPGSIRRRELLILLSVQKNMKEANID